MDEIIPKKYQSTAIAVAAGLFDYKLELTGNPIAVALGAFIIAHMHIDMDKDSLRQSLRQLMIDDRRKYLATQKARAAHPRYERR